MVRGAVFLSYPDPTPFLREILTDNQSSRYFPWSHENVLKALNIKFQGKAREDQAGSLIF